MGEGFEFNIHLGIIDGILLDIKHIFYMLVTNSTMKVLLVLKHAEACRV